MFQEIAVCSFFFNYGNLANACETAEGILNATVLKTITPNCHVTVGLVLLNYSLREDVFK